MKTEHIAILIGLIFGFILFTFFVRRALTRALGDGFDLGKTAGVVEQAERYNALNNTLGDASRQFERERISMLDTIRIKNQVITSLTGQLHDAENCALSKQDLQALRNVAETLGLALRTWAALPGSEPHQARAKAQVEQLNVMANRVLSGLAKRPAPVVKGAMHSSLGSRGIVIEGDTQMAAAGDAA